MQEIFTLTCFDESDDELVSKTFTSFKEVIDFISNNYIYKTTIIKSTLVGQLFC